MMCTRAPPLTSLQQQQPALAFRPMNHWEELALLAAHAGAPRRQRPARNTAKKKRMGGSTAPAAAAAVVEEEEEKEEEEEEGAGDEADQALCVPVPTAVFLFSVMRGCVCPYSRPGNAGRRARRRAGGAGGRCVRKTNFEIRMRSMVA